MSSEKRKKKVSHSGADQMILKKYGERECERKLCKGRKRVPTLILFVLKWAVFADGKVAVFILWKKLNIDRHVIFPMMKRWRNCSIS